MLSIDLITGCPVLHRQLNPTPNYMSAQVCLRSLIAEGNCRGPLEQRMTEAQRDNRCGHKQAAGMEQRRGHEERQGRDRKRHRKAEMMGYVVEPKRCSAGWKYIARDETQSRHVKHR